MKIVLYADPFDQHSIYKTLMVASCEAHSVTQIELAVSRKQKTKYPIKCDKKVNLPVDQHSIGDNNEMWAIVSFKLHQISN